MQININNRFIGDGCPAYIIAEISANHSGSIEKAKSLIKKSKEIGADAVKIQTYTADTLTIDCRGEFFVKNTGPWKGKSLYEIYSEAYTPWEWQPELKRYAGELGVTLFSSPFDKSAVDFLESIDVPAYKIASFEINDLPLVEHIARKGKPVIISTGIATLCEIKEAVDACRRVGNEQLALLKCTSTYPAPLESMNLSTIKNLSETFGCISGLSDHTLGSTAPVVARVMGAMIIEKHIKEDDDEESLDASFSLNVNEFGQMIKAVREAEKLMGTVSYDLDEKTNASRASRRSLFVCEDIGKDELLTEKNIRSIRPGHGLSPKYIEKALGKKAKKDLKKGTPLDWDLFY